MKDLIIRLWPAEVIPISYFRLVKRLVSACPRLEVIKAHEAARDARGEAQGILQEIQEARKIAEGKAFSMQSKYFRRKSRC